MKSQQLPIDPCTCGKSNAVCPVHPSGSVPNAITEICGVIRLNGGREVSQSGMSADFDDCMELIDSKELKCLRDELLLLRTSCIVEIAVRNPQVADYCNHWETRAEKAESELARVRQELSAIKGEKS